MFKRFNEDQLLRLVGRYAGAAFALIAIAILAYIIFFRFYLELPAAHEPAIWGEFGDYLGGVLNPIFGLFTFAGVLFTIGLQTISLQEARKSAEEARASARTELETAQRAAHEAASQTSLMQSQTNQLRRDRYLEDLARAIRLQSAFIDSELDTPTFRLSAGAALLSFRIGLSRVAVNARVPRGGEPIPDLQVVHNTLSAFDGAAARAAEIVVKLRRFGRLLNRYEQLLVVPGEAVVATYFPDTWRLKYEREVQDLHVLGSMDDVDYKHLKVRTDLSEPWP